MSGRYRQLLQLYSNLVEEHQGGIVCTDRKTWQRWLPGLPFLGWARDYDRATLGSDLLAAVIVTLMLIPQSLAYAMLAGLPPETGLYASIAPLVLYALFGTSRTLAVGPVAVVSLMTAAAIGQFAESGSPHYWEAAIVLAFISGLMLLAMGVLRLGFLANFLSYPVISGFISASGILIACSQLKVILGIDARGQNVLEMLPSIVAALPQVSGLTLMMGMLTIAFLVWIRKGMQPLLVAGDCRPDCRMQWPGRGRCWPLW